MTFALPALRLRAWLARHPRLRRCSLIRTHGRRFRPLSPFLPPGFPFLVAPLAAATLMTAGLHTSTGESGVLPVFHFLHLLVFADGYCNVWSCYSHVFFFSQPGPRERNGENMTGSRKFWLETQGTTLALAVRAVEKTTWQSPSLGMSGCAAIPIMSPEATSLRSPDSLIRQPRARTAKVSAGPRVYINEQHLAAFPPWPFRCEDSARDFAC